MRADSKVKAEILEVMKLFSEAYTERDLEKFTALFAPEEDLEYIGTGADERRKGTRGLIIQVQRDWEQSQEVVFKFIDPVVFHTGSVAWLVTDCLGKITINNSEVVLPLRYTMIMEKREGKWLIVHLHTSMPALEQPQGESFPAE